MDTEKAKMLELFGIPFSWFRQVDVHCDAFFVRKKMPKEPSMRERISADLEIAVYRAQTLRREAVSAANRSREAGDSVLVKTELRRKATSDK